MGIVGLIVGLVNGMTVQNFSNVVSPVASKGTALFTAVVATAFAYEGWIIATSINAELKDAKKNLPRALIIGTIAVIVIYILYYVGLAGGVTNKIMKAAEIVFEFDHLLCNFSGNTLLPLIFYSFRAPNTTLFERFFRLHGFDAMRKRTDALCSAVRARDLAAAIEVLSGSIDETISGSTMIYR